MDLLQFLLQCSKNHEFKVAIRQFFDLLNSSVTKEDAVRKSDCPFLINLHV